jgi:autotransporter-associated beta strand protein
MRTRTYRGGQAVACALVLTASALTAHAQVNGTWTSADSGSYGLATNWSSNPAVPGAGGVATFGSAIASDATVSVNVSPTLSGITFNSTNSYTLTQSASNAVTLVPTTLGDLPKLDVLAGTHTISVPLAGSTSLQKTGPGTLVLSGNSTYVGNTAVAAGVLRVTAPNALGPASPSNAVGVQFGGVLELSNSVALGNRDLLLATTFAQAPLGAVRSRTGSNSVGGNVLVVQSTSIGVDTGSTLTFTGEIIDNGIFGASTITKVGTGTLQARRFGTVSGTSVLPIGTLAINGGTARVTPGGTSASTSRVNNLSIAAGAAFDLSDNALVIDYSGSTPLGQVRADLAAGRLTAGGVGTKRVGYAEANAAGYLTTFAGQPVDATTIVLRAVQPGDSNLDGTVDFNDLLRLAQGYQQAGTWINGDFDYTGLVDFNDLLSLAQNYGQTGLSAALDALGSEAGWSEEWSLVVSLVPEPSLLGVVVGLIGPMAARSRKSCAVR